MHQLLSIPPPLHLSVKMPGGAESIHLAQPKPMFEQPDSGVSPGALSDAEA